MEEPPSPVPRAHRRSHGIQRSSGLRPSHVKRCSSLSDVNSIIISGIHPDTTVEALENAFSAFGKISACVINLKEDDQTHLTAVMIFHNSADAKEAVNNIHTVKIENCNLTAVLDASKEREKRASRGISVRKIPKDVTMDTIIQIFSRFGEIESSNSLTSDDVETWKALVIYQTFEAASAAVQSMHGMIISGNKPISVKFYDSGNLSSPSSSTLRRNSYRISSSDLFDLNAMIH